jgi:hypothetical protein
MRTGRKLTDLNIWSIAFVDRAANRKRFFLTKRDDRQNSYSTTEEPTPEEEAATVLKINQRTNMDPKIKKLSDQTVEVLKSVIAKLEAGASEAELKAAATELKKLLSDYPYPEAKEPEKTPADALENLKKSVEKRDDLTVGNRDKALNSITGFKEALGIVQVQKREDEVDIAAAAKTLSEAVEKTLVDALAE